MQRTYTNTHTDAEAFVCDGVNKSTLIHETVKKKLNLLPVYKILSSCYTKKKKLKIFVNVYKIVKFKHSLKKYIGYFQLRDGM